jgi:membrane-associated phospholipid phosphatase
VYSAKFLVDLNKTKADNLSEKEMKENGCSCFKEFVFYFLLIFLQASIMISRLYLGMHSLDQVFAGLIWGIFLHF